MRGLQETRIAIALLVLLPACANSTSFPDGAVPEAAVCASGETRCEANTWETCVNGRWNMEVCPEGKSCINNVGCRTCEPGATYCDGQDIFKCSADGQSRTKVQTCASDTQCLLGTCVNVCEALSTKDRSNVGCEFWAVDLPNEYYCQSMDQGKTCLLYGCAACLPFAVAVANVQSYPVTVAIDQNDAQPGETVKLTNVTTKTVAGNSLEVFELGMREVDCTEWAADVTGKLRRKSDSQTCVSSRAFRVKSTAPVVAYQFNPVVNDFSNGSSLLIPVNGLDTKYYVLSWSTSNPITLPIPGLSMEGMPDYTYVTVVGIKEQTQVEVTVTHPTQGTKDGKIPAAKKGDTVKVTLGPFDVLNLNSFQDLFNASGDLSGSLVKADKPVAVFTGTQRAVVPGSPDAYTPKPPAPSDLSNVCCTEHNEQQMFPVSSLGKNYVVTHSAPRQKGSTEADFYRVLAVQAGTKVTTNLAEYPSMTVDAGKWADFWATKDFVLTADKPVMVAQYTVSQGFLLDWAGPGGDPDMVLFPPVEQHRKSYIFLTLKTFEKDYVILAAPVGSVVKLDGKDVNVEMNPLCPRFPAGTMNGKVYNALRCEVKDGVHTIDSTEPVGLMVYGYYNVGSYAYPGGADVRQINIE
jgi:hypothetical protein